MPRHLQNVRPHHIMRCIIEHYAEIVKVQEAVQMLGEIVKQVGQRPP